MSEMGDIILKGSMPTDLEAFTPASAATFFSITVIPLCLILPLL